VETQVHKAQVVMVVLEFSQALQVQQFITLMAVAVDLGVKT
tara:strand:- start:65 stop:187 length:123 start_codon:yes stop_codon:yes gene_type:complete